MNQLLQQMQRDNFILPNEMSKCTVDGLGHRQAEKDVPSDACYATFVKPTLFFETFSFTHRQDCQKRRASWVG